MDWNWIYLVEINWLVIMTNFNKKITKLLQKKIGLNNYQMQWIAYFKGLIFGLILYHFFIK